MPMESVGKRDDLRISTFIPPFYRCPISLELMRDPVSLCTGVTYDRSSIEKWLDDGNNICPATREPLQNRDLTPNHTLRRLIQEWCVSKGIDRIPTPKSPADPTRVRHMMEDIVRSEGISRKADTLRALKNLAGAGEGNRKCMKAVGVLPVLAQALCGDPTLTNSGNLDMEILREAVGAIVCFSLDDDSLRRILRGPQLLGSLELLLRRDNDNNNNNTEARTNAAILVEGLSKDRASAREIGSSEIIIESLIGLLGEDIDEDDEMYPAAINASLNALLNLCSVVRNRVKIAEGNAVPALVDLVSGDDTELSERSLAVLDALSTTAEGRVAIDEHTLAMPTIAKSLLVVSNTANEHAVGILWRICSKSSEDDLQNEALVGCAFKKLLVLVQIHSSSPTTQMRAKQILKLLSPMRHSH